MKNQKLQVSIDDATLKRIDSICNDLKISRSSFCLLMIKLNLPAWEQKLDNEQRLKEISLLFNEE